MLLLPEKEGGPIKVDQVRGVVAFGQASAQQGGYRMVIVCPAEAMNTNAANSLLKTLEEPGANTLILLVTYAAATVLPTVRSRCQQIAMAVPEAVEGRVWLQQHLSDATHLELLHFFAPHQPLYGQRLEPLVSEMRVVADSLPALVNGSADVLATANQWASIELDQLLRWLYQWLSAACLVESGHVSADSVALRIHQACQSRRSAVPLLDLVEEVVALRRVLVSGGNPNRQLVLENLAFRLSPG
jgi:DNA polymerase-3 subunit delta'